MILRNSGLKNFSPTPGSTHSVGYFGLILGRPLLCFKFIQYNYTELVHIQWTKLNEKCVPTWQPLKTQDLMGVGHSTTWLHQQHYWILVKRYMLSVYTWYRAPLLTSIQLYDQERTPYFQQRYVCIIRPGSSKVYTGGGWQSDISTMTLFLRLTLSFTALLPQVRCSSGVLNAALPLVVE